MSRSVVVLTASLLSACATSRTAPAPLPPRLPTALLDWNGVRATWRDFPPGRLCEAEPRFLRDELLSVNELLRRFLRDTEGDSTAPWPEAQQTLVTEGGTVLPPVMEVHERNLGQLERCGFRDDAGYPLVRARGRELLEQVRRRLDEAPAVLQVVRRKRALEAWEQQRLSTQEAARQMCPSARVGAAVIYFAFRDLQGTTSFYFCDGATVTERAGEPKRKFEPPPVVLSRRGRVPEKAYLAAAERFSPEAIFEPPRELASNPE